MDDHEFKFVTFAHLEYHMHLWLIKLWICKPHIIIIIIIIIITIKSPRYTGGDFMFLYRFVRRRRSRRRRSRRRPQVLVHAITFEQLFGFLSFLARLLTLTYRLTD